MSAYDPRTYDAFKFEQRRREVGLLTRGDAADEIGVSKETVKAWETGKRPVPLYAQRALERYKTRGKR